MLYICLLLLKMFHLIFYRGKFEEVLEVRSDNSSSSTETVGSSKERSSSTLTATEVEDIEVMELPEIVEKPFTHVLQK